MRFIFYRLLLSVCTLLGADVLRAQTNGIFADFTTSMGTFTCQLSYSNAPKAVANFIGLATGQQPWLDFTTGQVSTNAFFNGLIFNRVVTNFVDQTGSPNGLGADGPGYNFVDEYSSSLTFNTPWMLGMANSGPDSNGSQFFVTVAPFANGNYRYVVFGRVVSGTNVVAAINRVATGTNGKPLTNVYLERVDIRREGAAALAFDITAQKLPLVTNVPLTITTSGRNASLTFSNRAYADNRLFSSTNFETWSSKSMGIEISAPNSNSVNVAVDSPHKFFRMAQVVYPSSTLAPKNLLGRKLVMAFSGGLGTNVILFNNSGTGSYTLSGGSGSSSGTIKAYTWSQKPYNGTLLPIQFSSLYDMDLQLNFSTGTVGTFTGTVYSFPPFAAAGSFTLTGP